MYVHWRSVSGEETFRTTSSAGRPTAPRSVSGPLPRFLFPVAARFSRPCRIARSHAWRATCIRASSDRRPDAPLASPSTGNHCVADAASTLFESCTNPRLLSHGRCGSHRVPLFQYPIGEIRLCDREHASQVILRCQVFLRLVCGRQSRQRLNCGFESDRHADQWHIGDRAHSGVPRPSIGALSSFEVASRFKSPQSQRECRVREPPLRGLSERHDDSRKAEVSSPGEDSWQARSLREDSALGCSRRRGSGDREPADASGPAFGWRVSGRTGVAAPAGAARFGARPLRSGSLPRSWSWQHFGLRSMGSIR